MNDQTQTEEILAEETARSSRKREITATVITSAVGVMLTLATGLVIGKIQEKVRDRIAPQDNENE